jgi:acyl transferase domain-containing protein/NAD(P)-dependent dehydrogenase (short-subunit alcohol dehydrogenase family)
MSQSNLEAGYSGLEVAVVGMAGRFPGARNIEEYWTLLKEGKESVGFFSGGELEDTEPAADGQAESDYVKAASLVEDTDCFDAGFFGYSAKEAATLDPQVRIFMECTWAALEDAGYFPGSAGSRGASAGIIGLFAGAAGNFSWEGRSRLSGARNVAEQFSRWYLSDKDFLSTTISYKLDLRGPSTTLYTACSTSLLAIHLACRALLAGECKIALAGGITIGMKGRAGYRYQEGMIMSPDGHCRAFDHRAAGTVFGDGVGVVVLKRLKVARAEGDHIYAVIRGSASNNDGGRKVGFTAPSVDGQSEVIRMASRMARVEPESITYVETHGTGTALGDPVEIEGLTLAFNTEQRNLCAIGSVKTNIGHLDIAAGVAGFIKTVLALTHRKIPPSLHFEQPNSRIDFSGTPFFVNAGLKEWENDRCPLRAGVSSFGIGGTNVHVVLEEAPGPVENAAGTVPGKYRLILLSAKSESALVRSNENLDSHFRKNPGLKFTDAAYTLQTGRRAFKYRQMVVCSSVSDACRALEAPERLYRGIANDEEPPVVFMFPGQGAQYVDMGRELWQTEPVFRDQMERCFEILKPLMGMDLKRTVYPPGDGGGPEAPKGPEAREAHEGGSTREDFSPPGTHPNADLLKQTAVAQPLLFAFSYALARLLLHWGITPRAMIGHSIGEYVAACLAGVLSLEDALRLVALRGGLMQQTVGGSMASVPLAESQLKPLLGPEVSLAAVNGSSHCVISGRAQAVRALVMQLKVNGHESTSLHTSHAFHSSLMDPVLEVFGETVARVTLNPPSLPYISNLSGDWVNAAEIMKPGYWSTHLRQPVRFYDGITRLLTTEAAVFVEVGPGRALSTFVRKHPQRQPHHTVINLVRHPKEPQEDTRYLLGQIGLLWLTGVTPDWSRFYEAGQPRRVSLPAYPFEPQRFTAEVNLTRQLAGLTSGTTAQGASGRRADPAAWFYIPTWKRTIPPYPQLPQTSEPQVPRQTWLFFMDDDGVGLRLKEQIAGDGNEVVAVEKGTAFARGSGGDSDFSLNPARADDYRALCSELQRLGKLPVRIVHLWNVRRESRPGVAGSACSSGESNVSGAGPGLNSPGEADRDLEIPGLETEFYSLLYLAQALGEYGDSDPMQLSVIATGLQEVNGEEPLEPVKATLLGPAAIIPLEYPHLRCTAIDIRVPEAGSPRESLLIRQLKTEVLGETSDRLVAFRGNHRLVRTFEPAPLQKSPGSFPNRLREEGVYLITGGLGGIGLVLAGYLARQVRARLILTGRTSFPGAAEWQQWLEQHPPQDPVSRRIRQLQQMQHQGAEVMTCCADVTDYRAMRDALQQGKDRWGAINGVIHCAGMAGGGLIQRKTREEAWAVIAPKVTGTLVLDRVLSHLGLDACLDFLVLCSSVNSVVPLLGQVDYYAANAFLDAFAFYRNASGGPFTVSINWDTWQEVGMAREAVMRELGIETTGHPLLAHHLTVQPGVEAYLSRLSFRHHWVLNEHMTPEKRGLLPGTAYLEMVRAAFRSLWAGDFDGIALQSVQFLTPLVVPEGMDTEVALILKKQGQGYDFQVVSRESGDGDSQSRQRIHAVGQVEALSRQSRREPRPGDLELIEDQCRETVPAPVKKERRESSPSRLLLFGPRWASIKSVKHGMHRALAYLELSDAFQGDLNWYKLHPALLDLAAGFLYRYVGDSGAYIPYAYKRLTLFGDLPARLYSYSRWLEDRNPGKEFITFDITLMDETGAVVAEIEEFTMMEVSNAVKERIKGAISHPRTGSGQEPAGDGFGAFAASIFERWDRQAEFLQNGLQPEEGIEVLERILAMPGTMPQVVVSTFPLETRGRTRVAPLARLNANPLPRPANPRPELRSVYVAPKDETERLIASMWQDILGIEKVGLHDDFFELGGDSLNIVQLNGLLKKTLERDIPVPVMFRYVTIDSFIREYLQRDKAVKGTPNPERTRSAVIKKGKERLKTRINRSSRIGGK